MSKILDTTIKTVPGLVHAQRWLVSSAIESQPTTSQRREQLAFIVTALLLLVAFPLTLSAFRLGLVGKYLTYAFAAVSLDDGTPCSVSQPDCDAETPCIKS